MTLGQMVYKSIGWLAIFVAGLWCFSAMGSMTFESWSIASTGAGVAWFFTLMCLRKQKG